MKMVDLSIVMLVYQRVPHVFNGVNHHFQWKTPHFFMERSTIFHSPTSPSMGPYGLSGNSAASALLLGLLWRWLQCHVTYMVALERWEKWPCFHRETIGNWLVVWNMEFYDFPIILGMSSSQLTFIFFRGVGIPPTREHDFPNQSK